MKKWFKVFDVFVASVMMLSAVTACSSSSQSASSGSSATTSASAASSGTAAESTSAGKGPYKIGWSTIYLTPSWMQQTKAMMDKRISYWKTKGVVSDYTIANANGDTSTQISQIENMIAQGYKAILLDAGSSTALNAVVEKAAAQGVEIVNFDSLVTTDKVSSTIDTSQTDYGKQCAEWLAKKIGGKGKIILFSGPAGVAVSVDRQKGAEEVLKQYPDIKVVSTVNSEYNESPALQAIQPVLDSNPDVAGILSLGGTLSSASLKAVEQKGMKFIPITGENYNAFMKEWAKDKPQGFSSYAVGQPNWLGVLAIDQSIRILNGEKYTKNVIVPLPVYTDDNLSQFVPNNFADDGYPIADITEDQIQQYLGAAK